MSTPRSQMSTSSSVASTHENRQRFSEISRPKGQRPTISQLDSAFAPPENLPTGSMLLGQLMHVVPCEDADDGRCAFGYRVEGRTTFAFDSYQQIIDMVDHMDVLDLRRIIRRVGISAPNLLTQIQLESDQRRRQTPGDRDEIMSVSLGVQSTISFDMYEEQARAAQKHYSSTRAIDEAIKEATSAIVDHAGPEASVATKQNGLVTLCKIGCLAKANYEAYHFEDFEACPYYAAFVLGMSGIGTSLTEESKAALLQIPVHDGLFADKLRELIGVAETGAPRDEAFVDLEQVAEGLRLNMEDVTAGYDEWFVG